jgi:ATP-dependent helicase/nuclease subunit A
MGWTKPQELAIYHKSEDGNLLVSASAGSGKTAVLTERVYQIIANKAELNSLLVLTFTNYAAQEMRDRIRNKLIDGGFDKEAASVDAVNFQTYDAFALSLVQKYCREIGVPNDVKIVDSTLIEIEKKKIIRRILDERYEKNDANIIKLVNKYCLKDDDKIRNLIQLIYDKSQLKYDSDAFIDGLVEHYYDEKNLKAKLASIFANGDRLVKNLINDIGDPNYIDVGKYMAKVREYLIGFTFCKSFDEKANYIMNNPLPSARGASYLDGEKELSYFFRDEIVGLYFPLYKYNNEAEMYERLASVKEYASTIISIVKELSNRLETFKKKYNIYTFQDIFKLAIKVVSLPHIQKKLRNQFKHIMIDEYQDTSDLQEMFVNLIANNNVFAVGDVKQSIYKFRNANCDLFQEKFNKYQKGDGGKLIILPENFRSRQEVIDDNNRLFKAIMTILNTGIDYSNGHEMKYGNDTYSKHKVDTDSYHTECIAYESKDIDSEITEAEYEARLIANDIIRRYNAHTQVMTEDVDSNGKKYYHLRNIKFSDFAILIYAKTNFHLYQKVFNEYQIPLYANYTQTIKENKLTMVLVSIFKLIALTKQEDYSKAYLHPFVSVLRSFLVEEKDDEIDKLFAGNKTYEEFDLFDKVKELADYALTHNLEELTKKIFDDFDIYDKLVSIGDITENIDLINHFISIAREMDEMNYSLEDYVKYYEELDEYDIEPEYNGGAPEIDSVKLMTIHASKGLQFKYVYYAKLDATFKHDATGSILFDEYYGLDLPDTNYQNVNGVFHKFISKRSKHETVLEQLRVFYVALTRAEEKAILLYKTDFRKDKKEKFDEANMYLDFVYLSQTNYPQYKVIMSDDRPIVENKKDEEITIDIKDSYKFKDDVKAVVRASKEKSEDAVSEALALGTKYHYYLELTDFGTKDTSFIKDEKDRKRIDRFLKNPLFDNASKAKVAHEYSFYDELNDVHGVIDLLLVYDDHIDIVDFKLSHVDDEAYEKQVSVYKDYISQIADGRDINLYILGILSGDIKKVC